MIDTTRQLQIEAKVLGRKITHLRLNPFSDGRAGEAYDPEIVLDNGTIIRFMVQETAVGEYGIKPIITSKV